MNADASRRLCFLVTAEGTALNFLDGYLRFLKERGWDVTLVCSPGDKIGDFARREDVELRTVRMRRNPSPLHDLAALFSLIRVLRDVRPDAIAYATPKASLLGSIAGAVARVQVRVYELWGLRLETARGFQLRLLRAMERLTMYLSTSIVANSKSLAERARLLGLSGVRETVVLGAGSSHGVDATRFAPDAVTAEVDTGTRAFLNTTSGMTIGFIGRMHPDKGVDTLLDAIDLCDAGGPEVRALFLGADEGAAIGAKMSAKPSIHWTGRVSDTRPYLREMDVLVLMSLREGFPNVVLEAASSGVPAIVANSTGTVDSVVHDVTGIVVNVGDADELATALRRMNDDPIKRREMGAAARRRAVHEFDQQHIWDLHERHLAAQIGKSKTKLGGHGHG